MGDTKGNMIRNQSHGSPANTAWIYIVWLIFPKQKAHDILRFKFATSAANVMGKKLVSSESATWLNEHFLSSWGDVKKVIDLFFLAASIIFFIMEQNIRQKKRHGPDGYFMRPFIFNQQILNGKIFMH